MTDVFFFVSLVREVFFCLWTMNSKLERIQTFQVFYLVTLAGLSIRYAYYNLFGTKKKKTEFCCVCGLRCNILTSYGALKYWQLWWEFWLGNIPFTYKLSTVLLYCCVVMFFRLLLPWFPPCHYSSVNFILLDYLDASITLRIYSIHIYIYTSNITKRTFSFVYYCVDNYV